MRGIPHEATARPAIRREPQPDGAKAYLQIKVDALDEKVIMEGAQKVANRITTGLIIAAMIVGAALMMDVQTSFQLFGYPGLAMLFFIFAGVVGAYLVITILFYDQPNKKRKGE